MKKPLFLAAAFPWFVSAQLTDRSNFKDVVMFFFDIVGTLTPIVAALALLAFLWGLVKFIAKAGDTKSHEEGKNLMIWGIIALFIMVAVFGIIKFAQRDLGVSNPNGSFIPIIQPFK